MIPRIFAAKSLDFYYIALIRFFSYRTSRLGRLSLFYTDLATNLHMHSHGAGEARPRSSMN